MTNTAKKRLKSKGVPKDYFEKFSLLNKQARDYYSSFPMEDNIIFLECFPMVAPTPTILSNPMNQNTPSVEVFPESSEDYYVETFPAEEVAIGLTIVAGVYIGACIVGAFFTGGQSLWGLALV